MSPPQSISTIGTDPRLLEALGGATVASRGDAQVQELAENFEATLLSMLLKEMRQTLEPEGLFAGDTGDIQGGLFDLFLGQHLAKAGGIGLAQALVPQLRQLSSQPTASLHEPRPEQGSPAPGGVLPGAPQ